MSFLSAPVFLSGSCSVDLVAPGPVKKIPDKPVPKCTLACVADEQVGIEIPVFGKNSECFSFESGVTTSVSSGSCRRMTTVSSLSAGAAGLFPPPSGYRRLPGLRHHIHPLRQGVEFFPDVCQVIADVKVLFRSITEISGRRSGQRTSHRR
jgi:hypothetical protein